MPLNTKHRLIPSMGINTYISMLMGRGPRCAVVLFLHSRSANFSLSWYLAFRKTLR